ncbi:MAG: hypothetical protein IJY66_00835 [Clostridia bacterium]|nr:hypothetical protein [Clostridia bacterium]
MKKCFALLLALCTVLSSVVLVRAAQNGEHVAKTVEISVSDTGGNSGEYVDTPDIEMIIEGETASLGIARALYFNWYTNGLPPEVTVPTFDITDMDYVAFDLYLSRADALVGVPVCIELTSSGICDKNEDSVFLDLNEVATLADGWNSVRIPLSRFPKGGADRTRINFFRIFNNGQVVLNPGELWVAKLKNFGFGTDADGVTQTLPFDRNAGDYRDGKLRDYAAVRRTTLTPPSVAPGAFMVTHTAKAPIDLSTYKYVDLTMHVTGAKAFRNIKFEMELTSSGTCDTQETNFTGFFDNVVEGWNTIRLPLSAFTRKVGGGADMSKINYIRLYSIGTEDRTLADEVTIEFAKFTFSDAGDVNWQECSFGVGKNATLPEEIKMIAGQDVGENDTLMFADGAKEIVYELTMDHIKADALYVTMTTGGEDLLLQIAHKNAPAHYVTVVGEQSTDPRGTYVYDLSKYINPYKFMTSGYKMYMRIADADPTNGNGGQIRKETPITISVEYSDWEEEGEYIWVTPVYPTDNDENDPHTISLFDCNAAIAGFDMDWYDYQAGYSSISYTLGKWKEIDKETGEEVEVKNTGTILSFTTAIWSGYDTIDATKMDTLEFWFYVSDKDALAAAGFQDNAMELTSSGEPDNEEINWRMSAILEQCTQDGWNAIRLPFLEATGQTGKIDLSRVNFFRWYFINAMNLPEQPITIKIDNIRLTDYVAQEREKVRPTVEALVRKIEAAVAAVPEWDDDNIGVVAEYKRNAETWRAQYSSLKAEYEALEPIPQELAKELGAQKLLLKLNRWLERYRKYKPDDYIAKDEHKPLGPGNTGETLPLGPGVIDQLKPGDVTEVVIDPIDQEKDNEGNDTLLIVLVAAPIVIVIAIALYSLLTRRAKKHR